MIFFSSNGEVEFGDLDLDEMMIPIFKNTLVNYTKDNWEHHDILFPTVKFKCFSQSIFFFFRWCWWKGEVSHDGVVSIRPVCCFACRAWVKLRTLLLMAAVEARGVIWNFLPRFPHNKIGEMWPLTTTTFTGFCSLLPLCLEHENLFCILR